jgi:hypothetical protein
MSTPTAAVVRPEFAGIPVTAAAATLAGVLSLGSNGYGFQRDELYFRMLPPAWGYVDQPPLMPLVVRFLAGAVDDEPWAIRLPATLAATLAVFVLVAVIRELGGGRVAQIIGAWGCASTSIVLTFGHVMLTAAFDLLVWPLVCLCVLRAVVRRRPVWWLVAGAVAGASMYNKLVIAMLLVGIAAGLLIAGPRRHLLTGWPILALVTTLAVGAPNLVYQATHGWPQIGMAAALAADNTDEVRAGLPVFLPLLLGPPLLPVLVVGVLAPFRSPELRPARWIPVALVVVVAVTWFGGTQFYYPAPLLLVVFAVGAVRTGSWLATRRGWRFGMAVAIAVNGLVAAVISLPVVPVADVGATPLPALNGVLRDSIGWPTYVDQIAAAYASVPPAERATTVVITTNYGQAGAVARYGPDRGLPAVYSGHNGLADLPAPPAAATTAIVLGREQLARSLFEDCIPAGRLDNGVGVDNEEQGQPLLICRRPIGGWDAAWPAMRHRG